jgi:hypothetical protein
MSPHARGSGIGQPDGRGPSLSLRGGAPILTIWRERSMQSFLDALEIWFDHGAHVDVNLHHIAQAIVTVLAVINQVVCGSIFLTLTPKLTLPATTRPTKKRRVL